LDLTQIFSSTYWSTYWIWFDF